MKSTILAGVLSLFLCFTNVKEHTLDDISKPYLGEYECKQAQFNDTDYLRDFSFIRLELKKDETYILSFKTKEGIRKEVSGKYLYDREKGTICFLDEDGKGIKREFPFKNGKMNICLSLGGKTLRLEFEQK